MRRLIAFLWVFMLAGIQPCMAVAGSPETVQDFFRQATATVIMPIESGVLIDKGSADQFAAGDLLAIVAAEQEVRHPETGALLDVRIEYGAHLVVTKVQANISYCRFIGTPGAVTEGARVHRYENVPVYFYDQSGTGFSRFTTLRDQLPHLQWQPYQTAAQPELMAGQPGLLIRSTADRLTVLNQDKQILFVEHQAPVAPPAPQAAVLAAVAPADSRPAAIERYDLPLPGEIEALRIGDLDQDGTAEILLGVDGALLVYHLDQGQLHEVARLKGPTGQQIVDISALDLDRDGKPEVVVSALNENRALASFIEYEGGDLRVVAEAGLLLATFAPLAGEPVLIGMEHASILQAQPALFEVELNDRQPVKKPFQLPGAQQPYGVLRLANADGPPGLVVLSEDDRLRVLDQQGRIRWESAAHYGGSTVGLKVAEPGKRNPADFRKYFFRAKLHRSPRGTILVTQHDGPGLFRNSANYTNGRLIELAWNGTTLDEVAKTGNLGGMIVDHGQYDLGGDGRSEIIAAVVYQRKGFKQEPQSGLVVLTGP